MTAPFLVRKYTTSDGKFNIFEFRKWLYSTTILRLHEIYDHCLTMSIVYQIRAEQQPDNTLAAEKSHLHEELAFEIAAEIDRRFDREPIDPDLLN